MGTPAPSYTYLSHVLSSGAVVSTVHGTELLQPLLVALSAIDVPEGRADARHQAKDNACVLIMYKKTRKLAKCGSQKAGKGRICNPERVCLHEAPTSNRKLGVRIREVQLNGTGGLQAWAGNRHPGTRKARCITSPAARAGGSFLA